MIELVEFIAKNLVDEPDAVRVQEVAGSRGPVVELRVAPEDMGKVIGRGGRIAKAIRTVIKAAGNKQGKMYQIEIVD